jgi:diguanylate cyclase (GGDEF)-like protein/PAS domain S-box-containing protein
MELNKPRKKIYKLLDSASHMKSILNAVNEGVITFNSKLKIMMVNRFALNLWSYSRDELLGENLSILIAKPYSERLINYTKKGVLSDKINALNEDIKIKGIKKNKTIFPVSLNFVENKIDEEMFYTVAVTDLTDFFKNKEIQNCILKISNSVRISTNIKQLYREIYKNLTSVIATKDFTVSLIIDKKNVKEYNYSDTKKSFEEINSTIGNIIEPILKNKEPLIYCQEQIEYLKEKKEIISSNESPNSYIGSPLIIDKEIIGVISIKSFDETIIYNDEDLNILNFISDQIAMAIDKVKSVEEMHYLAYYDKMTKLPNRTLFNDRAKFAFKTAPRNNEKYTVLFLDLDEFKLINDTMGHNAGDKLLKNIARTLIDCVRQGDTISHWGGDEFTILSKIKDNNDNEKLCERILKNIKKLDRINNKKIDCTVSIGAAIYPDHGDNIDDLIQKADMAMYVSKTKGKDNFTIYNNEINNKMLEKLNLEVEIRKKFHQIDKK